MYFNTIIWLFSYYDFRFRYHIECRFNFNTLNVLIKSTLKIFENTSYNKHTKINDKNKTKLKLELDQDSRLDLDLVSKLYTYFTRFSFTTLQLTVSRSRI